MDVQVAFRSVFHTLQLPNQLCMLFVISEAIEKEVVDSFDSSAVTFTSGRFCVAKSMEVLV